MAALGAEVAASGVEDIYELCPLQRGMLLHAAYDGDTDVYTGQHVFAVDGPLDTDALERAWRRVFAAHPALRTSFHWEGLEKPLQVVHSDVLPAARRGDWSHIVEPERRARLGELLADDRAGGFDLATPPLQRLHLVRTGDDRHLLAWSHHHLLLDGWSVPVFMNEVMAHYAAITVGGPTPPPAPSYRDYIAWTVNEFDDGRLDLLVDYIPELLDAEWVGELVEEYFTTIATELARPDRVIGTAR